MDIPTIINHNYYVVKSTTTNRAWICEAERFDDIDNKLYYYYGTYELGSEEHKNNRYLSNSYYDILPSENDKIRLATMEDIDILMDILEENGVVTTLQEAKDKAKAPDLKGEDCSGRRFRYQIPEGYEFETIENGKIIFKPIKPKYPKTYKECAKIMNCPIDGPSGWLFDFDANIKDMYYRKIDVLMGKFIRLLICRDAYWKIASNWKPDWNNISDKYTIYPVSGEIWLDKGQTINTILAFPTKEIRDAFYENFKDLIKQCKELL